MRGQTRRLDPVRRQTRRLDPVCWRTWRLDPRSSFPKGPAGLRNCAQDGRASSVSQKIVSVLLCMSTLRIGSTAHVDQALHNSGDKV